MNGDDARKGSQPVDRRMYPHGDRGITGIESGDFQLLPCHQVAELRSGKRKRPHIPQHVLVQVGERHRPNGVGDLWIKLVARIHRLTL